MASLIAKRINGGTYWYLREVARVGGRPKIVSQRYLGKAEDIAAMAAGATQIPERSIHRSFGDVAAVWGMLRRLRVAETIDEVVGARRADAAASVGTYLALATLGRIVAPCSKRAFSEWWSDTAGPRFTRIASSALDHRRFWDAMDAVSEAHLAEIERRLARRVVEGFGIDCQALVLDMTNFATFIDSSNARSTIARRGHAKDGRVDLRLVGLALVVSRDGVVPLAHHPYPGNAPDVTQFRRVMDELLHRYAEIGQGAEATIVYDAGNSSVANQHAVDEAPLHCVCSLVTAHHPELLGVPRTRFSPVKDIEGLSAHETTVQAFGATRRAIITHSEEFHAKQVAGFAQTLAKATRQLDALAGVLGRGRARRSRAALDAEIARICAPRWVARVMRTELTGERPRDLRLKFALDRRAMRKLEAEHFGKRILITSQTEWSVAEVVRAYRSQTDVESAFRQMKDPKVVSFSPMFHWTDQKVRVHVFYCVLALTIAHLMRREAARAGLDMSVRELLRTLGRIEETVLIYPAGGGRPRARRMLTEMDSDGRRLFDLFGLGAFAPRF
ncbi:MAG: IS1634 family transposase [Actinomycetota bacterium]